MDENNRRNFGRDEQRGRDEERERRWREEGAGREEWRGGQGRFGSRDAWEDRGPPSGLGSAFRDDDQGRYAQYGARRGGGEDRGQQQRGHWAHDAHGPHLDAGHRGAGRERDDVDSRYFTGGQGSYGVRSPYDAIAGYSYGSRFGHDYRDRAYARQHEHDNRGFWDRATDEVASWFGNEDAARRRDADHSGRGPKDYVRSDERIREDAHDRLTDDSRVDASNVSLTVEQGEITLTGTVSSREEKRRAEDVVERISGVKHVQNNLRVSSAAQTSGDYPGNWALNRTSTAEGGTIDQRGDAGAAGKETDKI